MNRNKWIGFLSIIALLAAGVFAGFRTEAVVLCSLAGVGIITAIYYFLLPAELPSKLTLPAIGEKNQILTGYFHVMQPGFLPIFYGKAYGRIRNHLMGDEIPLVLDISLLGKEEGIAPFQIRPIFMGMLEITIERVEIFGLLGCKKKIIPTALQKEVMIFPKTREISLDLDTHWYTRGEGEELRYIRHGFDSSMYHGVRPYEEGDSLKNIHWKLTGKTDDYMIKELGEQATVLPTLFLETVTKDARAKTLDGLLEKYISISQHLVEEHIHHRLFWRESPQGNWRMHRVEQLSQLDEAFDMLFRITFQKGEKASFFELPQEEWEEGQWLIVHALPNLSEKAWKKDRVSVEKPFSVFAEGRVVFLSVEEDLPAQT